MLAVCDRSVLAVGDRSVLAVGERSVFAVGDRFCIQFVCVVAICDRAMCMTGNHVHAANELNPVVAIVLPLCP